MKKLCTILLALLLITGCSFGNKDDSSDYEEGVGITSYDYVLNTRSKKFHIPSCFSVDQMSEKNKEYFSGTRDEVIDMGYDPCGNCNP